jgi:hypothetical protein
MHTWSTSNLASLLAKEPWPGPDHPFDIRRVMGSELRLVAVSSARVAKTALFADAARG